MAVVVTGIEELDRKFANLPLTLQKKIERKALRKAAKPLLDEMKRLVPKDEGELATTISVRAMKRSRKNKHSVGVKVGTDPKKLAQIHKDNPGQVFNPHWIEFGAPGHVSGPLPPQPYARPARDSQQTKVIEIFRQEVTPLVAEATREA